MASTTNKLQDPNLSNEEQDAIIGAFVRRHENERLRQRWEQKLTAEHGVIKQLPAKKRMATIRKISIAIMAVAASLLLFFVVLPQFNQPAGGEALLAAYVSEISIDNSRGVAGTDAEALRRQVADAYNNGDYAAAITAAETLAQSDDARPEDALNLGKAHLRNGGQPAAQRVLRGLISQSTDFTTEARYVLGLSLLSEKKTAEAVEALKKIRSTDGAKIYQKARALIEEFE